MATRDRFEAAFAEQTVEWAEEELALSTSEIAGVVGGVDRKTVQRWRQGRSAPRAEHRKYLEYLNQLRHLLETSFRTDEAKQRWIHTPSPAFGGRTPFFVLTDGEIDTVLEVLAGLAHGSHR